jgi:hypothetical protein
MNLTMILGLLLALSVAWNGIIARLYVGAREDVASGKQAYASHLAQDRVVGEEAAKKAKVQEMSDKLKKDTADAENKAAAAATARTIAELRHQRDSATRGFLSATPPNSRCPDKQTCLDSAEFQRAYGEHVTRLRGLADEGTAVTTDLDTARKWARVR